MKQKISGAILQEGLEKIDLKIIYRGGRNIIEESHLMKCIFLSGSTTKYWCLGEGLSGEMVDRKYIVRPFAR